MNDGKMGTQCTPSPHPSPGWRGGRTARRFPTLQLPLPTPSRARRKNHPRAESSGRSWARSRLSQGSSKVQSRSFQGSFKVRSMLRNRRKRAENPMFKMRQIISTATAAEMQRTAFADSLPQGSTERLIPPARPVVTYVRSDKPAPVAPSVPNRAAAPPPPDWEKQVLLEGVSSFDREAPLGKPVACDAADKREWCEKQDAQHTQLLRRPAD